MRDSAFTLNVRISHFFCRRFCHPSQEPSGKGDFCVKMKVWTDLANQIRENLCEKRDFGQKFRGVWKKNSKELFGKLFYVWRKTQVRLNSNVLVFWEMCFWAF